jgi:hypothetical protein
MKRKKNPIFDIDAIKKSHAAQFPNVAITFVDTHPTDYTKWSLVELLRGTPSWTRVAREAKKQMNVEDLIVLNACAETVLNRNTALKGALRKRLRLAVNRSKRHVKILTAKG